MSERKDWLIKEKRLTDEVINDILFHKNDIGIELLLQKSKYLLASHLEVISYLIDNDFETKLDNAKQRYELQRDTIKECSEFSTEQAIEIAKLKNKIISHESTMRANGIIK